VLVAAVDVVAGMASAVHVAGKAADAIRCLCYSRCCDHSNHNAACLAAADASKGTFPPAAPFLSLHFFQCAFLFLCAFLSLCVSRWAG